MIKEAKLPATIDNDYKHELKLDGQVVAKYCNKCRRFNKGKNAHNTSEHTPARPKANMAASPTPMVDTPAPAPPTQPMVNFVPCRETVYDFGNMHCRSDEDDDDGSVHSAAQAFFCAYPKE